MPLLTFDFAQIDFLLFVISIAANAGLGIIVWKHGPRTFSTYVFSIFIIVQILWLITTYASFRVDENLVLLTTRFVMFFATFHAFFFFLFAFTFSGRKLQITKLPFLLLTALGVATATLTLSPYVFTEARYEASNYSVEPGPGMIVFGLFAISCVLLGIYSLIRKYHLSQGTEKVKWRIFTIGLVSSFLLIIGLSFLNSVLTNNANLARYGHFYTLPFVFFASYAILKHHFLNIKVFATELFAFLIIGISVVQITFARNFTEFVFSAALLALLIIFSTLLIRSMNREIKHQVQEAAYEELRKLDEAKSEFITIASHQFRTPLSAIKGYLSMLLEGFYEKNPQEEKKVLQNVSTANERLISLTDSLLHVSRMQSGKIDLRKTNVQLETLVENLFLIHRPKAQAKNLELVFLKPKRPLPQIAIDQEKIRTVIEGVIDNAIRYTKQGKITISLASRPKSIILKVEDTGKGLSKEECETIFRSFSRGKTAQSLWTEGVGLSLYIAKQFVEAHGGRIWAASAGPEQGSTFHVELPLK